MFIPWKYATEVSGWGWRSEFVIKNLKDPTGLRAYQGAFRSALKRMIIK
jgi:hypothetical protein